MYTAGCRQTFVWLYTLTFLSCGLKVRSTNLAARGGNARAIIHGICPSKAQPHWKDGISITAVLDMLLFITLELHVHSIVIGNGGNVVQRLS